MQTKVNLDNINCGGCVNNIKKTLAKFDGISEILVDIPTGEVLIDHSETVSTDDMLELLEEAGYPEK